MTRSFGDLIAKSVGVICEPEIKVYPNLTNKDKIIVIASDGLWDRIPNDEVMKLIVTNYYDKRDAEGASSALLNEAV